MDSLSSGVAQAVQVYTKGTKAWFEDEDEAWVSASVLSKEESGTGVKIIFQDDKDEGRVSIKMVWNCSMSTHVVCSRNMSLSAPMLCSRSKKVPIYRHFVTHRD